MKQEGMRWSRLFDDLESQAEAMVRTEEQGEIAERTRIETGRLRVVDRLRAAEGHVIDVRCAGAGVLRGRLDRVGADWLLLGDSVSGEVLVPMPAVVGVAGLGRWSATLESGSRVAGRLGLRSALRGLARDRVPVQVLLIDGSSVAGTVDRVGADYLELAEHPDGEARRASSVLRVWTIPLGGVGAVRRR